MPSTETLQKHQITETVGRLLAPEDTMPPLEVVLTNTWPDLSRGRVTTMRFGRAVIDAAPAWPDSKSIPPARGALVNLTDAELCTLALNSLGAIGTQVARLTCAGVRTVDRHQDSYQNKLGARSPAHATVQAVGTKVLQIVNNPHDAPGLKRNTFRGDQHRKILLDILTGSTDIETAELRSVSVRTVQRRIEEIKHGAGLPKQNRPRLALQLLASGDVTIEELAEHAQKTYRHSNNHHASS